MNQQLKKLFEIIQQSESLSTMEKSSALKALKDAEKESEILSFKLERTEKVKTTTAILLEETISELEQKRMAVEAQNRELEIEACLERIRASALAMKEPPDMLSVCRIISEQLELLKVKEIRNVQTAIFYESKGIYLNYEYYPLYDKSFITEVEYNLQPDVALFVNNMLKDSEAYFTRSFDRSELKNWIEYQKNANHFVDPKLYEAESLHFYFYSIGPGALGLSTYNIKLNEEDLNLLKRFRNVFELAYRRFIDIERAIAQAREAQIEAALERLRSKAMAMHNSENLSETVSVFFKELKSLNVLPWRCGVGQIDEETRTTNLTTTSITQQGESFEVNGKLKQVGHPVLEGIFENWKLQKEYYPVLRGKDIKKYYDIVKPQIRYPDYPLDAVQYGHFFYFKEGLVFAWTENKLSEEELNIFRKFSTVLSLTYRRYMDLKEAEAQAREARIEAALEKVRGSAMAMHNSNDLSVTASLIFTELRRLGIYSIRCGVVLLSKNKREALLYAATSADNNDSLALVGSINMSGHPLFDQQYEHWLKNEDYFTELNNDEIADYYKALNSCLLVPALPDENARQEYGYYFAFTEGLFYTWSVNPYQEKELNIIKRFKTIVDLTFRRYLDIKKAEAQAKEAKIEASLERVRTHAIGIRKPNDLLNICEAQFTELKKLGFKEIRNTLITVFNDEKGYFLDYDYSDFSGGSLTTIFYNSHPVIENFLKQIKSANDAFAEIVIDGKQLDDWREFRISTGQSDDSRLENIPALYYYFYSIGIGAIGISTFSSLEKEKLEILKRFRNVFDFAYRRYSDVSLAEAQAREAQIEAALERVRARTMAMHSSDELADTASVLFRQLIDLGISPKRIYIAILKKGSDDIEFWITDEDGCKISRRFDGNINFNDSIKKMYEGWQTGQKSMLIDMTGNELEDYLSYLSEELNVPFKGGFYLKRRVQLLAYFSSGCIGIATPEPQPPEITILLERFAGVFDLAYTRFIDLKNAEAQAREAKIEAALERVRTKAMAMHSSNDYNETIRALYFELSLLSLTPRRCGIGLIDKETKATELSTYNTSDEGDSIQVIGKIKLEGHPILNNVYENYLTRTEYFPVIRGHEMKEYYDALLSQIPFPDYSDDPVHFGYYFFFRDGTFYTWTNKELNEEEKQIYRRFTSVFALAYARYLDLIEAEKRTAEAIKQASMDRIRAEIASLRNIEDLNRITPIIWRELTNLNVPFVRCGVFIIDEQKGHVQVFLTTPEGKALGFLNLPINVNNVITKVVEHWRTCKICIIHWNKVEFMDWTKTMMELGQVQSSEAYQGAENPPEELDLHFVPFRQGMLYVGNTSLLSEQKLELVRSLAEAFSIAYARYEDFINLEEAKANIEDTLKELKSAQAQLVHSEKMASLGELTAGIAHEIKNPLNFVNNFSELSRSLLDDMKAELENNNLGEALEIVKDLEQNLERINHHGKRADSIVKGMLLHSRGGSGDRILTNINDLLEQFVSLAYHGMKAQDKEFNITIEKSYDESIGKINIVPQDISRVFLNIINNACYAANEKKKKCGPDFSPVLSVSTKNLNDKIEIRIHDNGDGIPGEIRDKLFKPFFTTKPTGSGTGLGLSLSYDIVVKQHAGEIKFESEEGKYTEFIITLPKQ